jgi:rhomboid protease GluP
MYTTNLLIYTSIILYITNIYFNHNIIYSILLINNNYIKLFLLQFFHKNLLHLFMNCYSIYNFRTIEHNNYYKFNYYIIYLIFICPFIEFIIRYYVLQLYFTISIGISSVIFGLISIFPPNNINGIVINKLYTPIILLILTSLFHHNSSFIGHLSGLISGYLLFFFI